MISLRSVAIIVGLAWASAGQAAIVTVRRDGTGDFASIPPALHAAASGDTILIGPGEYTEVETIRPAGWAYDLDVYGQILVSRLTIIGAGSGVTVIGPPVAAPFTGLESPDGLITNGPRESIYISDLTVRNCYVGLSLNCNLQMERCRIDNNRFGLSWTASGAGGTVRECRFATTDAFEPLGLFMRGVAGVLVEDCEFVRAGPYVQNHAATFSRCEIRGPDVIGFHLASGTCQLSDCVIADVGIGLTTGYPGSRCEVRNSRIAATFYAVRAESGTSALIENTTLGGGSDSVVRLRDADSVTIHGCDFVRGTGPIVRSSRQAVFGSVTHDLAGNYWGTTDEATIQSWIIDHEDDSSNLATVVYSPYAGQSVPTESITWGDLKAGYR